MAYKPYPTIVCGACTKSWGTYPSFICGPTNIICSHCGDMRKTWLKPWSLLTEREKKSTINQCLWGTLRQYLWLVITFTLGPFMALGSINMIINAPNISDLDYKPFFLGLLGIGQIVWYVYNKIDQAKTYRLFFRKVEEKYYKSATNKEDCFFESKDYEIDPEDLVLYFD
tara:strand:+ start:519 stop:1028 length:510 start_codon:yes stop_codon:yes gene_type:complete